MSTKPNRSDVLNFLPEQYERDDRLTLNHNYLPSQFDDYPDILEKIAEVVRQGDFTLGKAVDECEALFASRVGAKHAIGVGSGTDALFLSLKALGVGPGDEVITTPFTFYATIGAIVTVGAKPVFVDVKSDYNIDETKIANAITDKTKAVMPVHWAGRPCELATLRDIVDNYGLHMVQDACHAIEASYHDKAPVSFGDAACYSLHPLKNLNVWGDGGFITTDNSDLAHRLSLMRNHGLKDRDTCVEFAYNSRLDTIQAVVAKHLMEKRLDNITSKRITNAKLFNEALADIPQIQLLPQDSAVKGVFHLYQINCEKRDLLQAFLTDKGIDAKVHYPVPMHLQPAAKSLGHVAGDFPRAEYIANTTLSLPVHEYVSENDVAFMAEQIKRFYQ